MFHLMESIYVSFDDIIYSALGMFLFSIALPGFII